MHAGHTQQSPIRFVKSKRHAPETLEIFMRRMITKWNEAAATDGYTISLFLKKLTTHIILATLSQLFCSLALVQCRTIFFVEGDCLQCAERRARLLLQLNNEDGD
jgi:hypothetical protein